jgi:hypothetical protein
MWAHTAEQHWSAIAPIVRACSDNMRQPRLTTHSVKDLTTSYKFLGSFKGAESSRQGRNLGYNRA